MSEESTVPGTAELPAQVARAVELLLDRKAEDVVLLDLRDVSAATDFFIVATGRSDTHVSAIGDFVAEELRKEGVRAFGVEGMRSGRWVLLDYVDFVVHIFHPAAREFYQLERLWGDVPLQRLSPDGVD
ncbi:MAG: ribosome silencing factor [Gemmatimonadota bacterium]|jgi:ribosome-associated protein|nr:ribosome silencing factor [Gemmatimonadota bacterium]